MTKHILVYSQYFYPEQFRINDICIELIKLGYKVSVVTGIPNYPQGKFYDGYNWKKNRFEQWNGIDIYRIPIIPRGKKSIGLVLNYASFVLFAHLLRNKLPKNVDLVFTYEVSPMTQALPAIWYAQKHKLKHYLYVMDLWPENILAVTGIKNQLIIKPIDKMVQYIYEKTSVILTSSKSFVKSINQRGISINKLKFWPQYAEDIYQEYSRDNTVVDSPVFTELSIAFAGNIGEAQGLEILPEVAYRLIKENIKVKFVLIGDGRSKANIISLIKKYEVERYFLLIDRQPAELIPYYLAKYDISLISLAPNEIFAKTIPAKVQSSMACGKPLIISADGEVQQLVKEAKCGLYSAAGDVEGLVNNIRKFIEMDIEEIKQMGRNSKDYYIKNFDRTMLMNQLVELIEKGA
ncbi:glycosyltransferase family 4 protein [Fundicoccus culcitae]|uniref:Glycosyltransferase family 4 protein n=1 Tax=Fundicoccus culcitae TaxID=2969821 RepID=A0ABY5P912_9LACT|nr:glycosyltransferase family 4 protein [Fundicoccus culcitae]UUX35246.1 glycosyltransferase family 4 protein [Fundicoccus culcitae]